MTLYQIWNYLDKLRFGGKIEQMQTLHKKVKVYDMSTGKSYDLLTIDEGQDPPELVINTDDRQTD